MVSNCIRNHIYRGVSTFLTNCSCCFRCRELTACRLYVSQHFRNIVLSDTWLVSFTQWRYFSIYSILLIYTFTYSVMIYLGVGIPYFSFALFRFSIDIFILPSTIVIPFSMDMGLFFLFLSKCGDTGNQHTNGRVLYFLGIGVDFTKIKLIVMAWLFSIVRIKSHINDARFTVCCCINRIGISRCAHTL